ncbi:MAG: hypothetical protein K2N65_05715, partial [Anaeroplasmataceae bacterium]|nr:hypothetical protein [Anaeroplasmataceae bacterium]
MTETIYLKDLTKYEEATEFGKITYYQEQEGLDMDIRMFMKNGTVYIESNLPIKLLADSNLKIKDEHYADEMILEQNFEFDTSWYDNKKHTFQFKQFLYSIGQTISKFFSGRKKEKFLYFCLFLIGCVLAFSIVSLLNSTSVDVSEFYYNRRYSALLNEEKEVEARTVLKDAYEKDAIDTIVGLQEVNYTYRRNISFNETLNLSGISYMLPYVDSKVKVAIGRAVEEEDEVVIYRKLAESIIKESPHGLSYNDILGSTISLYSLGYTNDLKIVGISDKDQGIIYISDKIYGNVLFHRDHSYTVVVRDAKKEIDENGDLLYSIVKGRDVDLESYTDYPEILVNDDDFPGLDNSKLPYKSNINGKIVTVVGSYKHKYEIENKTYISNRYTTIASIANAGALTDEYYLMIEGRKIQSKNEIIVPYLSNYELGEDVNGYIVVGKYTGSSLAMSYGMLMNEQSAIIENYSNTAFFNVKNAPVLKEITSNSGYRYSDSLRSQALIINDIN